MMAGKPRKVFADWNNHDKKVNVISRQNVIGTSLFRLPVRALTAILELAKPACPPSYLAIQSALVPSEPDLIVVQPDRAWVESLHRAHIKSADRRGTHRQGAGESACRSRARPLEG